MRISVRAPVTVPIDFELDTGAIAREMALRLIDVPPERLTSGLLKLELERALRELQDRAIRPTIPEKSHEG